METVPPIIATLVGLVVLGEIVGLIIRDRKRRLVAERVQEHMEAGLRAGRARDYVTAVREFELAIRDDPHNDEAHRLLARMWFRKGGWAGVSALQAPENVAAIGSCAELRTCFRKAAQAIKWINPANRVIQADLDLLTLEMQVILRSISAIDGQGMSIE
jgi:hypothetical protein